MMGSSVAFEKIRRDMQLSNEIFDKIISRFPLLRCDLSQDDLTILKAQIEEAVEDFVFTP